MSAPGLAVSLWLLEDDEAVDAIAREHLAEVRRKLADLSALRRNWIR